MLIRSPSRGLSNVVSFTNVTRSTTVVSFPPMGDLPTVGDLPDIGDIGGGGFISYTDGSGDFFTDDGSLIDSSGGFTSDWGGSGGDGGYTSYDDQAQVIFASDTSDFDGPADDEAQDGGGNRKATFWDAFWKGFNDSLNNLLGIIGLGIGPPKPSPKFEPPTNAPQLPPTDIPEGWRIREMPPTQQYPDGYWKLEKPMDNGGWQAIDPSIMKPGTRPQTHIPFPPKGK